jgi:hypothetical protein
MRAVAAFAAVLCASCGGRTLTVELVPDDAITDGLPGVAFADGGSAAYDALVLSVAEVQVAGRDGDAVEAARGPALFDATRGEAVVAEVAVDARRYERLSLAVVPASDAAVGSAREEDTAVMTSQRLSVLVRGTVSHDEDVVTFAWRAASNTRYTDCAAAAADDAEPGIDVTAGDATWAISVSGRALFQAVVGDPTSPLISAPFVRADLNDDGAVDHDELAAVRLSDVPEFDVGALTDLATLADIVVAQLRGVIGGCTAERR